MDTIAILFCKDFPEVVRKARGNEPLSPLETSYRFVEGLWYSVGNTAMTAMPQESSNIVDAMVANGYTVTGFFRLSDFQAFVPFDDEIEKLAATAANEKILEKLLLETLSN